MGALNAKYMQAYKFISCLNLVTRNPAPKAL